MTRRMQQLQNAPLIAQLRLQHKAAIERSEQAHTLAVHAPTDTHWWKYSKALQDQESIRSELWHQLHFGRGGAYGCLANTIPDPREPK